MQLDPANVEARSDLSKYYTQAPAIMGGGLDKARDQATQVNKYDAAEAHSILAQVAAKEKRYDEAESQFHSAIKEARNPATYWLQLADFYRLRGRFDDVQKTVLTAMTQPSGSPISILTPPMNCILAAVTFRKRCNTCRSISILADWWRMHRLSAPTTC